MVSEPPSPPDARIAPSVSRPTTAFVVDVGCKRLNAKAQNCEGAKKSKTRPATPWKTSWLYSRLWAFAAFEFVLAHKKKGGP
jgi:hypothetical protein